MSTRYLPLTILALLGLFTEALAKPLDPPQDTPPRNPLVTRVYEVADLIIPVGDAQAFHVGVQTVKGCRMGQCSEKQKAACGIAGKETLEDQLIRLIVATIQPQSWSSNGGAATIDYYPLGMALVINQTPDAQEQVAELLAALRRLQEPEVVVELRVVAVSDACMKRLEQAEDRNKLCPVAIIGVTDDGPERVGIDFEGATKQEVPSGGAPMKLWVLHDSQVAQILGTVQGDCRTTVLQAPKLTVANGQASAIDLTDKEFFVTEVTKTVIDDQVVFVLFPRTEAIVTGWKWSVQPVVSADRKYVRLKLMASQASVVRPVAQKPVTTFITPVFENGAQGQPVPFTQYVQQPQVTRQDMQTTVTIPDGGTAMLSGWTTQREGASEIGPPVLSKVPYVNRLFKNVASGCETEHVLVLVTPRIINRDEEEHAIPVEVTGRGVGALTGALIGHAVEQEEAPSPGKKTHTSDAVTTSQKKVAHLLDKYHQACVEGRLEEAKKLARRALTLDPACFDKQEYAK
jgi:hypothetical protein